MVNLKYQFDSKTILLLPKSLPFSSKRNKTINSKHMRGNPAKTGTLFQFVKSKFIYTACKNKIKP